MKKNELAKKPAKKLLVERGSNELLLLDRTIALKGCFLDEKTLTVESMKAIANFHNVIYKKITVDQLTDYM